MTQYEVDFYRQFASLVKTMKEMTQEVKEIKESLTPKTCEWEVRRGVELKIGDIVAEGFFGKFSIEELIEQDGKGTWGKWRCHSYDKATMEEAREWVKKNYPSRIEIEDTLLNRYIYREENKNE